MMIYEEEDEEVLAHIKRNKYTTPPINKKNLSKYELDQFFLDPEHSVIVMGD